MLRLPSRHILRAFYKHLQARPYHSLQAPFLSPSRCTTLSKGLSPSTPSPPRHFSGRKAEEKTPPGGWVDIHNISGPDPNDYDVLITDIDYNTLHRDISDRVGIPYLKGASKDEANMVADKIHGFVYGRKFRMILPCVLRIGGNAHWVFFIVDTGAPLTYLSTQVAKTFNLNMGDDVWPAHIAGHKHTVYRAPPDSHFANINILGGDFCYVHGLLPWVGRNEGSGLAITYYIGEKWGVTPRT